MERILAEYRRKIGDFEIFEIDEEGETGADLERFFHLDDADRDLIASRRGGHNRLGFAVQLGTVRFLGTFLVDPLDVPWGVVEYLAGQLGIADSLVVKRYTERVATAVPATASATLSAGESRPDGWPASPWIAASASSASA